MRRLWRVPQLNVVLALPRLCSNDVSDDVLNDMADPSASFEEEIAEPTSSARLLARARQLHSSESEPAEGLENNEAKTDAEIIDASAVIDPVLSATPIEELVDLVLQYLRTTINPALVSAEEEERLFPVLLRRIDDIPVPLLLDLVSSHWARSTTVRYGVTFKDLARDNILALCDSLTPDEVRRALIVLGISAGRRKRDLVLFKALGMLLVKHINAYKDPVELVQVITAFNRAKIVPPDAFIALIGRRLPVLSKKHPLSALSAYRALSNFARMGHTQMNPFRFLADRVLETIHENLKKEKIFNRRRERMWAEQRAATDPEERRRLQEACAVLEAKEEEAMRSKAENVSAEDFGSTSMVEAAGDIEADAVELAWVGEEASTSTVRHRFLRITELRPAMFTRLLSVVARLGAPHQQYLRPLIVPLIAPSIPYLPPPSFSRLIAAMRSFRTTDQTLLCPVVDHMYTLGVRKCLVKDVLEFLHLLSLPDTPVPKNVDKFMDVCLAVMTDEARLRSRDMCAVAFDLLRMSSKDDVSMNVLEKLYDLISLFATRMTFLLDLGVLLLAHADALEDICRQLKHPDASGAVAHLRDARRRVNKDGDDEYHMQLDIDVRETFFKLQVVDTFNTHGGWNPIPGLLQLDFRQALTNVRLDNIIEAVHLYHQAYPNRMRLPLKRIIARSVMMKMRREGEEYVDDMTVKIRPVPPVPFTKESLKKFVNLIEETPLRRVRNNPVTWEYISERASRLRADDVRTLAAGHLERLKGVRVLAGETIEVETDNVDEPTVLVKSQVIETATATA